MTTEVHWRPLKVDIVILAIILALGIFLRLPPELFHTSTGPLHALAPIPP